MTAATLSQDRTAAQGLRPVNSRRDMAQIAELLNSAFGPDLDPGGQRMIREMKTFGSLGWLGWLAGLVLLPAAAHPRGYVWESGNRVVGNASLLPVEGDRGRWVLANVVVQQDHRRQGIAREMVRSCIEKTRQLGGEELVLQVNEGNKAALSLYRDLGFQTLSVRTTWRRSRSPASDLPAGGGEVRPRKPHEWRWQWSLARGLHPEGLIWPYSLRERLFRTPLWMRWLGMATAQHWVLEREGRLLGSLTLWDSIHQGKTRLALLVEPSQQGEVEGELLTGVFHKHPAVQQGAVLDYPRGLAVGVLEGLGFEVRRSLAWMRLDVRGVG